MTSKGPDDHRPFAKRACALAQVRLQDTVAAALAPIHDIDGRRVGVVIQEEVVVEQLKLLDGLGGLSLDPSIAVFKQLRKEWFESWALFAAVRPAIAPKTRPSSRELLAMRLAPWTPVDAASPQHNRPSSDVEASNDV